MTIEEITYALWRKLEGGFIPDDTKYTYRELELHVRGAVGEALRAEYFNQMNADDFKYSGDAITTKYKMQVQMDVDSGLKTITLPSKQLNVPSVLRNLNITSLNPVGKLSTTFIPVRTEQVFTQSLQDPIPCTVLYYIEGVQITFYLGDFDDEYVLVHQKYSIPSDKTATTGLPEELLPTLLTQAMRLMQVQLPSDRQNDGVPKT